MIVMPANATGIRVGYVARRYEHAPARLGHLYSPGGQTGPHSFMPYALDNGAFGCWQKGRRFDAEAWRSLLAWAASAGQRPLWVLVPDAVGDSAKTRRMWRRYANEAGVLGSPLAFAAQDGNEPSDVPADADVIFLGGDPKGTWKWDNLFRWCATFPGRVHVGRVNTLRQLRLCADAGAASCDGTGLAKFEDQWRQVQTFLAEMAGERHRDAQTCMSFDHSADETAPGSRLCAAAEPASSGEERH